MSAPKEICLCCGQTELDRWHPRCEVFAVVPCKRCQHPVGVQAVDLIGIAAVCPDCLPASCAQAEQAAE